jgi:hypothetical protein
MMTSLEETEDFFDSVDVIKVEGGRQAAAALLWGLQLKDWPCPGCSSANLVECWR